jgi:hypothetical protein
MDVSSQYAGKMRGDKYVVLLTREDYRTSAAGMEKYISDELRLLRERKISSICLFPFPMRPRPGLHRLLSKYGGVIIDGTLCGFHDVSGLAGLLSGLQRTGRSPLEIQIHHLMHFDLERVGGLLRSVEVPVKLFLHDYYTICPQYNLLKNGTAYCGDDIPCPRKCADCSRWTPGHHEQIRQLLESVADRLTVVSPSPSTRQIWLKSFPDFAGQTRVIPHLRKTGECTRTYAGKTEGAPVRLAYIGSPVPHKGWGTFVRLMEDLSGESRRYAFYHFGLRKAGKGNFIHIPVSFVQDGPRAMTEAIRKEDIDIVLLWASWPETYSYTLHESWAAHVMFITNPGSGNITDVVRNEGLGRIFDNYPQLLEYLRDEPRVRNDIDHFRGGNRSLPAGWVPNEEIMETIHFHPDVRIHGTGGPGKASRFAGVLYRLKQWKRRRAP